MPWIEVVAEDKATGYLKKIYKEIKQNRGKISNIMKVHSLNPSAMKSHLDLYLTLMFEALSLNREELELIAVVVSASNNCEYCLNHHSETLNSFWEDNDKIRKLKQDYNSIDLTEKVRKMLKYAVKLTKTPDAVNQDDICVLRKCGFSDVDILNINLVTSYFCFVNRIALGLGVEFSPDELGGYRY
jgi:uncharacterized peroxidase-related enzyme